MVKKIYLIACKDYNFYNFRSELILKLVEMGYDVTLICPEGNKIPFFKEHGCNFIGHTMDRRGTNPINDLKLLWTYYKIFKKGKPDLVLSYTTKSVLYGGIACRILRIPYIVNNAGLLEPSNYNPLVGVILKGLYRLGFKGASCMMYQNSREREVLNKILKNKIPYHDIPGSGVNLETFSYQEYPKEDDMIYFNYVARVVRIKGIDEYLTCAERIHERYPNALFRIFGEFDEVEYEPRIKKLEAKGVLQFCGSKLDMKPYIAEASAAIHASYYEGMTNVILEHGAMGRPTVASDIPGCRESIDNGKSGFLFPVKDVDALVDAVEKFILLSHEERVAMGKAARKKMEREFDRAIVTKIYLEEIKKILN